MKEYSELLIHYKFLVYKQILKTEWLSAMGFFEGIQFKSKSKLPEWNSKKRSWCAMILRNNGIYRDLNIPTVEA